MNLEELKLWKDFLGYSNKMLAEKAGLPLGTVQKILSGETERPRYKTIIALEKAINEGAQERAAIDKKLIYLDSLPVGYVHDSHPSYAYADCAERPEDIEQKSDQDTADITRDAWKRNWRRQGTYTAADYDAIPDEIRVELIDGKIYDLSAPSFIHQQIVLEISSAFKTFQKSGGDRFRNCRIMMAPFDVELDEGTTIVQPDIMVFCGKERKDYEIRLKGSPDFVVEVVSPSSRRRDMVLKTTKYMEAGVKEYWVVDPDDELVWVYDFAHDHFPLRYTFDDTVPVLISGGELSIDFTEIMVLINEL